MDALEICRQKLDQSFDKAGKLPFSSVLRGTGNFKGLLLHTWAEQNGTRVPADLYREDVDHLVQAFRDAGFKVFDLAMGVDWRKPEVRRLETIVITGRFAALAGAGIAIMTREQANNIAIIMPTPHYMAVKADLLTRALTRTFSHSPQGLTQA
jgi:hypothetical protein